MKCEYCGGTLTLETLTCPHCGRINKYAQQHVKDMNRYQGEFEDTQNDVYQVTRNYAGIAVRGGIIGVLLVIIIILTIIMQESYSIRRGFFERRADKRYEEYSAIMDQYLAEEEYLAFYAFCQKEYIDGYNTKYESYTPILRISHDYKYVYDAIMEFYTNSSDPKTEDYMIESNMERLINQIDGFYEAMDMKHYEYYEGADTEENRTIMQRMELDIRALLQAYCGLTEEDLTEWGSMSNARRIVVLEERLGNAE